MDGNALGVDSDAMQAGGPPAGSTGVTNGQAAPGQDQLGMAHDQAKAQFAKLTEQYAMVGKVGNELEQLAKLGDMITTDDVVKGAGKLVAHGYSAMQLASLLSDMPDGGPAIASWVQQHAQITKQSEQQLGNAIKQARSQLGSIGLQSLTQHARSMDAPPMSGNALMPGGNA